MPCYSWCCKITSCTSELGAELWPWLDMPPPKPSISFSAVVNAVRLDLFESVSKRPFIESCIRFVDRYSKIDDPHVARAACHVEPIHPRLEHVGIGPPVRVDRR